MIQRILLVVLTLVIVPFNIVSADDLSNNSLVEDDLEGNSLVEDESESESESESENESENESDVDRESDSETVSDESELTDDGEVVEEIGDYEVSTTSDGSMTASTTTVNPLLIGVGVVVLIGLIALLFLGKKKK